MERARNGEGPSLIEAETYRFVGHYFGKPQVYRSLREVEQWKKRDPIRLLREWLEKEGLMTAAEADRLDDAVMREIEEITKTAREAPFPDGEQFDRYVYA